ncbi:MAG: hypothetical protein L3K26_11575, partial [Candidatus Hydrogenedentes bacterium]|nr:hypothetical protein [Candidatus Hydrogenedentota bacterium]
MMIGIPKKLSIAEVMRGALLGTLVAGVLALPGTAVNAEEVSFSKDIRPVLEERCFKCHGEKKQKGEVRLDDPESIMIGGEEGPVIVAGKPEESKFYTLLVLPSEDEDIMPAKGGPLTEAQIKAIHAWITAGAKFDAVAAPTKP